MRAQKFPQTFGAGPLYKWWWSLASFAFRVVLHHRLMPDSAVDPARPYVSPASADDPAKMAACAPAPIDAAARLARAARPVQRGAVMSRAPYGAPTLDLFAEDTERATLQALNTDIRQCTLPGFELPDVFMAAVEAVSSMEDAQEHLASIRATRHEAREDDTAGCSQPEAPANGELPLASADHSNTEPHTGSRKSSPQVD